MLLNAKLTKISSNENALRTNEVVGTITKIPEVGYSFMIGSEPIDTTKDIRIVTTSVVKEVFYSNKVFRFKTLNSEYQLDILDEVTEEEMKQYATFKH